jgi:hypothetical protein
MSFFGNIAAASKSKFLAAEVPVNTSPIRMLIIGDSIANGFNEDAANGEGDDTNQGIANADTFYEWDGTNLLDRVGGDTLEAKTGSQYPSMANKLKELTGRVTHIVETASPGAEFVYDHNNNHWGASPGYLYDQMLPKANSYLTNQSVSTFDVIKMTLGINDARGDTDLSEIQAGTISLIDRLNSDFPNAKIILNQLGKSTANQTRVDAVRGYLNDLVTNYANVYHATDLNTYPSGDYFDGLHLYQTALNKLGEDDAVKIANIL